MYYIINFFTENYPNRMKSTVLLENRPKNYHSGFSTSYNTMIRFMIDYHVWAQTICIYLLLILIIGRDDTHDPSVFIGYVWFFEYCACHAIYLTRNPCAKYIIHTLRRCETLWSAREIALMALGGASETHGECVSQCLKTIEEQIYYSDTFL